MHTITTTTTIWKNQYRGDIILVPHINHGQYGQDIQSAITALLSAAVAAVGRRMLGPHSGASFQSTSTQSRLRSH